MNTTVKRNYREDFSLLLSLKDPGGEPVQHPSSAEEAEKWRSLADKVAAKNVVIAKG